MNEDPDGVSLDVIKNWFAIAYSGFPHDIDLSKSDIFLANMIFLAGRAHQAAIIANSFDYPTTQ